MKKNGTSFAAGLIAGAVLFGGGTAMAGILAEPSTQPIYVDGQQVSMTAYSYVRNLYETRRILYTFFNAMGEDETTWKDGKATKRGDGTSWVHIQLSIPDDPSRSLPMILSGSGMSTS